jgi:hypothetical protein
VIKRHGFAVLSTSLLVLAVVLLAVNEEKAAVYVTLGSVAVALIGAAVTSMHRT